jgi:hypothetical protein
VHVLGVAEVESLFCTQEVLEFVSRQLARNAALDFAAVSDDFFKQALGELETQISIRATKEIKFQLTMFDEKPRGAIKIADALNGLVAGIKVQEIYDAIEADLVAAINARDYGQLLSLYNRKSLSSQAGGVLGLKAGELPEVVLRLAKGEHRASVAAAMRPYFGSFGKLMV